MQNKTKSCTVHAKKCKTMQNASESRENYVKICGVRKTMNKLCKNMDKYAKVWKEP